MYHRQSLRFVTGFLVSGSVVAVAIALITRLLDVNIPAAVAAMAVLIVSLLVVVIMREQRDKSSAQYHEKEEIGEAYSENSPH